MRTTIHPCSTPEDTDQARTLFRAYEADLFSRHGVHLGFQNFEAEMASLPGVYVPPAGVLLLATDDSGRAAGCVAVRPLDPPRICELKRLFVLPEFQGAGVGRKLLEHAIVFAREAGYEVMRLDTLPAMTSAIALYRAHGFGDCPGYNNTPHGVFLELRLR